MVTKTEITIDISALSLDPNAYYYVQVDEGFCLAEDGGVGMPGADTAAIEDQDWDFWTTGNFDHTIVAPLDGISSGAADYVTSKSGPYIIKFPRSRHSSDPAQGYVRVREASPGSWESSDLDVGNVRRDGTSSFFHSDLRDGIIPGGAYPYGPEDYIYIYPEYQVASSMPAEEEMFITTDGEFVDWEDVKNTAGGSSDTDETYWKFMVGNAYIDWRECLPLPQVFGHNLDQDITIVFDDDLNENGSPDSHTINDAIAITVTYMGDIGTPLDDHNGTASSSAVYYHYYIDTGSGNQTGEAGAIEASYSGDTVTLPVQENFMPNSKYSVTMAAGFLGELTGTNKSGIIREDPGTTYTVPGQGDFTIIEWAQYWFLTEAYLGQV